jgi:hypothetical protein
MEWRAIFEMFRLLATSLIFSTFFVERPQAAPPVDLSDFDGSSRTVIQKDPQVRESDLIFTDNVNKPERILRGLVEFKKDAVGRTHASPSEGRAVMRFRKEYRGRFLQFSKDQNWVAIELLNGRRRAWVPRDSIEILDEDYIQSLGGKLPGGREN